MTPEESKRLIEIVELIVEQKIQKYALPKERLAPTAFEERYMNHYTHGMFIDHVLFRKHLHQLKETGGVKYYDTFDELKESAEPNSEMLYITTEPLGFYKWDDEAKEFVPLFDPFSTEVVDALPTEDISEKRIYLVKRDESRYELIGEKPEDTSVGIMSCIKEIKNINGCSLSHAKKIYNSLPQTLASFDDRESAEAEAAKYKVLPVSVRENKDIYDEYVYVNGSFELLGADMDKYYTKAESDKLFGDVQEIPLRNVITVKECTREEWNAGMVDLTDTAAKFVISDTDGSYTVMSWTEDNGWAEEDAAYDTLYISDSTPNMYKVENGELELVVMEGDGTLYINSLDELDDKTASDVHNVVWIQRETVHGGTKLTCSAWTLYVNSMARRGAEEVTQVLSNRDGCYFRTGKQPSGGEMQWGAWQQRTYVTNTDLLPIYERIEYTEKRVERTYRKQRTSVHYCSSRMKYAMPKIGTTVLIDDNREHFWGFASFGRPKNGGYGMKDATADDLENVAELVRNDGESEKTHEYRYYVNSGAVTVPEWVRNYWNDPITEYRGAYLRVKPFRGMEPEYEVIDGDTFFAANALSNCSGSTGLTMKQYLPNLPDGATIALDNVVSPVCDLCARVTLNSLTAATTKLVGNTTQEGRYDYGDIVRFDGKRWVRIDKLDVGRAVRVLYQGIRVERTGGKTFRYDNKTLRLPEFKSLKFTFESGVRANSVASPKELLDKYMQYCNSEHNDGTFRFNGKTGSKELTQYSLAVFTKYSNHNGKGYKWSRCIPNDDYPTGSDLLQNPIKQWHFLLAPYGVDFQEVSMSGTLPWYADAYIVAVRKVVRRQNTGHKKQNDWGANRPYDRNIEVSNRIPVRVFYIKSHYDEAGTVQVRVQPRRVW